jgi:CBS domain-containing protein
MSILDTTKAQAISQSKLVTISSEQTVEDALKLLIENNVYSLPVIDHGKCVQLLNIADCVTHLVSLLPPGQTDIERVRVPFFSTPVSSVASHTPIFTLPAATATVREVARLIVTENTSRVLLVNESQELVGLASQSAIVKLIGQHLSEYPELSQKTVLNAGCLTRDLITVSTSTSALEAFRIMSTRHYSHLAIVDEHSYLVANISVKDIKGCVSDWSTLSGNVHDYVNAIRRQSLKAVHPAVGVEEVELVGRVIQRLIATHMHRLYLTASVNARFANYVPTGVISLRDVLKLFV